MAPFNWFNRQYTDDQTPADESAEPTPAPETVPAPAEATKPDETSQTPQSPQVNVDQLNWAKAALENIRKRQQETAQPPPSEELPSSQDSTVAPPAESETLESFAVEAIEAPTVEEKTAPEPLPDASTAVEVSQTTLEPVETPKPAAATPELAAPETAEPEPIAPSPSALPFWAKAEAERLERLERLRAEAIAAEPDEPEVPQTTATATVDIPDLVLDEAFVWSAEILAAQGRRPDQVSLEEITWLKRLRQGLDKTRRNLVNQLRAIVGQGPLNQAAVMEIESLLLQADVGLEATDYIVESLQKRLRQEALPPSEAIAYLKGLLQDMLNKPLNGAHTLSFVPEKGKLNIWLITGVNGAGKTTTIGKLAHIAQKSGYRCLIAAADTFRAAAVEQIKVWGQRSQVEVISNPGQNTDPAAVVFDAIAAAQSRHVDLLLVDTAGRLQNKKNLMDELAKIRRIIDKKAPDAKVESLLVLDSTLGQNGLRQAEVFSEAAKLSGVVLTKLDGSARGGIALAVVQQLSLPIRFIGAGEGIEDLRPFSSYEFVEALLSG
jgi:fused signal recognition particle receptor